mgnify:CR=1 FL=1
MSIILCEPSLSQGFGGQAGGVEDTHETSLADLRKEEASRWWRTRECEGSRCHHPAEWDTGAGEPLMQGETRQL